MHEFTVNLWADASVKFVVAELPSITLDGSELDPRVVAYLIEYGARQSIRDAAAAEKDDDKRNAKALKRVDALVNNTVREVTQGARLSPVDKEMRAIAEAQVRAAFENPANANWIADQRKATKLGLAELREATIKRTLETKADSLRVQAEANIAARADIELDLGDIAEVA